MSNVIKMAGIASEIFNWHNENGECRKTINSVNATDMGSIHSLRRFVCSVRIVVKNLYKTGGRLSLKHWQGYSCSSSVTRSQGPGTEFTIAKVSKISNSTDIKLTNYKNILKDHKVAFETASVHTSRLRTGASAYLNVIINKQTNKQQQQFQ